MSEIVDKDDLEEKEVIEAIKKPIKKVLKNATPKVIIKKKVVVKVATPPESEEEEEEVEEIKPVKVKRERTDKQKEAFARCLETKKVNAKKRNDDAKRLAEFEKAALEEKIVKKAISIKKKQIKKQSALDEISDNDDEIEVVREKGKKPVITVVPKPMFTFL